MSAVDDLRQALESLAGDCEQTAGALAEFKDSFDSQAGQIEALIGNSSTGADQKIAQRYDRAREAVEAAVAALLAAGQDSSDYSSGL